MNTNYSPKPINVDDVELTPEVLEVAELLAENTHEVWAQSRMSQGWTYGAVRNDELKQHPDLIPYNELAEEEKQYDRDTAMNTLKLITKLGYKIVKR